MRKDPHLTAKKQEQTVIQVFDNIFYLLLKNFDGKKTSESDCSEIYSHISVMMKVARAHFTKSFAENGQQVSEDDVTKKVDQFVGQQLKCKRKLDLKKYLKGDALDPSNIRLLQEEGFEIKEENIGGEQKFFIEGRLLDLMTKTKIFGVKTLLFNAIELKETTPYQDFANSRFKNIDRTPVRLNHLCDYELMTPQNFMFYKLFRDKGIDFGFPLTVIEDMEDEIKCESFRRIVARLVGENNSELTGFCIEKGELLPALVKSRFKVDGQTMNIVQVAAHYKLNNLLDVLLDPASKLQDLVKEKTPEHQDTALHLLLKSHKQSGEKPEHNFFQRIRKIVSAGADVTAKDKSDKTPLDIAKSFSGAFKNLIGKNKVVEVVEDADKKRREVSGVTVRNTERFSQTDKSNDMLY